MYVYLYMYVVVFISVFVPVSFISVSFVSYGIDDDACQRRCVLCDNDNACQVPTTIRRYNDDDDDDDDW